MTDETKEAMEETAQELAHRMTGCLGGTAYQPHSERCNAESEAILASLREMAGAGGIGRVISVIAERDAALDRALAAEAKLEEAVGLLRRIANMGREVIQPTRIERDCIAWEDRSDARPSPAPTIMCDECERPMMRDSSCEWHCEHCHPAPTEAPAPGTAPCGKCGRITFSRCSACDAPFCAQCSKKTDCPCTDGPATGTEEKEPTR